MDAHSVFCARKNGGQCDCGFDPPLTPGQKEILRIIHKAPLVSAEAKYRYLIRPGVQWHDGAAHKGEGAE